MFKKTKIYLFIKCSRTSNSSNLNLYRTTELRRFNNVIKRKI